MELPTTPYLIGLYTVLLRTNDKRIQKLWHHFDRVTVADKSENVLFVGIKTIHADSRVDAIKKAYTWYWNHFNASFGPSERTLTVSDPDEEVRYSATFSCARTHTRYLDKETALRLVAESKGELAIRTPGPSEEGAYWRLFRRKKRRNKPSMMKVGPCVLRGGSGVLYYRHTIEPQVSKGGKILVKRKTIHTRLKARTLREAYLEIATRKLRDAHRTGRKFLAQARRYERFLPRSLLTHNTEKVVNLSSPS